MQGFLTAYNYYGPGNGHANAGTDNAGREAWIDNYCRTRPLESLEKAANQLIDALEKRH